MTTTFTFHQGRIPLLVSIPHDGRKLAPGMQDRMGNIARSLPDTDWHVRMLYAFAEELGASVLAADYSRYVVDLNRAATDEALYGKSFGTGLSVSGNERAILPIRSCMPGASFRPSCGMLTNNGMRP